MAKIIYDHCCCYIYFTYLLAVAVFPLYALANKAEKSLCSELEANSVPFNYAALGEYEEIYRQLEAELDRKDYETGWAKNCTKAIKKMV